MEYSFTVQRGSTTGVIVPSTTKRQLQPNEAYVKITHSGVCGTDEHWRHSGMALGHEGVGIVLSIGADVRAVNVGDRVGFGYVHKICGQCEPCLTGRDQYCFNKTEYGSHDHDLGSFATHTVWDAESLVKIPDGVESEDAAPLMCGGVTVWAALSLYGVKPTDRVGIVGIGGLGHLAIQFAAKMGCEVVAFSSSESKRDESLKLGASEYHVFTDTSSLQGIRKVNHILLCGSGQTSFGRVISLVAPMGKIYNLTVDFAETSVPLLPVLAFGLTIQGSAGAPRAEFSKMLSFAERHKIKPIIMTWPLDTQGVEDAMKALKEGKTRYRGVLVAV